MFPASASPETLRHRRNIIFTVVLVASLVVLGVLYGMYRLRQAIVDELTESGNEILKLNQSYKIAGLKPEAPIVVANASDDVLREKLRGNWQRKTSPWNPAQSCELQLRGDGSFDALCSTSKEPKKVETVTGKWSVKDRSLVLTPSDKALAVYAEALRSIEGLSYSALDPASKKEVVYRHVLPPISGVLAP